MPKVFFKNCATLLHQVAPPTARLHPGWVQRQRWRFFVCREPERAQDGSSAGTTSCSRPANDPHEPLVPLGVWWGWGGKPSRLSH